MTESGSHASQSRIMESIYTTESTTESTTEWTSSETSPSASGDEIWSQLPPLSPRSSSQSPSPSLSILPRRSSSLPGPVLFAPIQRVRSHPMLTKKFTLKRPSPRNPFSMADVIMQRISDMRISKEAIDPPMLVPTRDEPVLESFWPEAPVVEACGIEHLPTELIVRIFSFLDIADLSTCAKVCCFFSRIAMDGSLWSTLDFSQRGYYKRLTTNQLQVLAYVAGGFLRKANFRGCLALTSSAVNVYGLHCPNIKELDLQGCIAVNGIALSSMITKTHTLRSINVTGLASVSNTFLEMLGSWCGSTLKVAKLGFCKNVTSAGVKALLIQCPHLTELNVSRIQNLDQDTLQVMGTLKGLNKVDMRACGGLTPRSVAVFLANLAAYQHESKPKYTNYASPTCKLVDLRLSANTPLTDVVLYALGTYAPLLETLELAGCRLLTDAGIASLMTGRALAGHVVDIEQIHHRGAGCERLRNLDLEDVALLTDEAMRHIGSASCAASLQRLALGGMEEISDAGVTELLQRCKNLVAIELDNCARLTDGLVEEIVRLRMQARRATCMARAAVMDESHFCRHDSGYGDSLPSSPATTSSQAFSPLLNTPLSSSPETVELDVWDSPPTMHLTRIELFDCRSVSREACRTLEKRAGLEVGSFYTSGVSSDRSEERANRRRAAVTRIASCSIL